LTRTQRELAGEFVDLNPEFDPGEVEPRYNIAPTQPVLTVAPGSGRVRIVEVRWGIMLPPTLDRRRDLINVRAETALRPGWFRERLGGRRVLAPASHFYEWRALAGRRRQPMLIGPAEGDVLAFAGLLGGWTDEATGEVLPAVAILTCEPNAPLRE